MSLDLTTCKTNINKDILSDEYFLKLRNDFPILKNDIVYLDNSATSQKPSIVIEEINNYYLKHCSNIGRSNYKYEIISSSKVDTTRCKVADFLNVNKEEIVFTSGATESSNLIAYSYGLANLKENDEILICDYDHKSTVLPWYNVIDILKRYNSEINIRKILIDVEGDYKEDDLVSKVNSNTKVIVLTHIHNVYGLEMGVEEIIKSVRKVNFNCKIILDCSQSVGHIKVDLKKLDVDFAYFSGHKMFSETGIGICYIRSNNFKYMKPFMVGGSFKIFQSEYANMQELFENGTLNISGIFSLGRAIDYIQEIGVEKISDYILELTRYFYDRLKGISEIEFLKGIDKCGCRLGYGIISFKVNKLSSSEIGEILADYNIYVRTGNFCKTTDEEDSIRVSLHIYNNKNDINKFIKVLKYVINQN